MGLNDTVSAERPHIAFFGCRNAGKSSLINAVTGQTLSVVSDHPGTTTDPVKKAMELLPLGPVEMIDTAGIDDIGELGELRVQKTNQILKETDFAVLVVDASRGISSFDEELIRTFKEKNIPYLIAFNKSDLLTKIPDESPENHLYVSAVDMRGIHELKETIAHTFKNNTKQKQLLADKISPEDIVILVIPIDASAPKGRLILPQQQTIREILDTGAIPVCCRDTELPQTLAALSKKPALVITDSQAFERVAAIVPKEIPMTSFSILFARYKGELSMLVRGAKALHSLNDHDRILISEGCTHHRQCGDIGTVKLPAWISAYTGKQLAFDFTSGGEFPEQLSDYALIVHCGGCMLTPKAMQSRMETADAHQVPMVNYGVAIAQMHGILERSIAIFSDEL